MLRVTVPVRVLVRRLALAIILLAALHLLANFLQKGAGLEGGVIEQLVHYFSMDEEVNVPTWFTVVLLASTGLVTGDLLHAEPDRARHWAWGLIAFVLLYLSIDEMTTFHEHLGTSLEEHFRAVADLPFNGWIAFYGPLALVVAAVVVPLLWRLPRQFLRPMALAGVLYVLGAVGFEAIAGLLEDQGFDRATFVGQLAVLGEESLEMIAVLVFLAAVVSYRAYLDTPDVVVTGRATEPVSGRAAAEGTGTTLHP